MASGSEAARKDATQASDAAMPRALLEGDPLHGQVLPLPGERLCHCKPGHLNCLSAKEWLKRQIGVWEFYYEGRDIRDKQLHPATFPLSLARQVLELFTHRGELVLDPFVGSGTSLVAAQDCARNAVGFDLSREYIELCAKRLDENARRDETPADEAARQLAVQDDARNIPKYFEPDSLALIWTSPPYANLLNRERKNKSRRKRDNEQLGKVEQYSQDPRDLGTLELEKYTLQMGRSSNRCCRSCGPRRTA